MSADGNRDISESQRRARAQTQARRMAWALAGVALLAYAGFIALGVFGR